MSNRTTGHWVIAWLNNAAGIKVYFSDDGQGFVTRHWDANPYDGAVKVFDQKAKAERYRRTLKRAGMQIVVVNRAKVLP